MHDACPIIGSYLAQVRKYVDEDAWITEAYLRQLDTIDEALVRQGAGNTLARQHQRAFLSIEWTLYRLPASLPSNITQQLSMSPWPRSREGLTTLVTLLRGDTDELLGAMTEHTLSRGMVLQGGEVAGDPLNNVKRKLGDMADQMYQDNRAALQHVYRYGGESAIILRRALRNPCIRLTRVGVRLAKAARAARIGMSSMLELAEILLAQQESNAVRAWEIPLR